MSNLQAKSGPIRVVDSTIVRTTRTPQVTIKVNAEFIGRDFQVVLSLPTEGGPPMMLKLSPTDAANLASTVRAMLTRAAREYGVKAS